MAGERDSRQLLRSVSLRAASVAVACTCLGLLLQHSVHIQELRQELQHLKLHVQTQCVQEERWGAGVAGEDGKRSRRAVLVKGTRRQRQLGHKKYVFVHLVPQSTSSVDEEDKTLVKWTVGQKHGEALQVSGETITVTRGGLYFIYSQVLYEDATFVMGHMIKKRLNNQESSLMKCVKSMPDNITKALNTCYTAGVQYLESGSVLELSVPRKKAGLILLPHATFMGIYKI